LPAAPLSIALIRQRYAADGGAERFVARLLDSLQGRNLHLTLVTRRWIEASGFDVVALNPFYIGRLWRDWSFGRAVRRLLKTRRFNLVQSHERIAGCDIYRAGDGVHREWLAQRARTLSPPGRLLQAISPYHGYMRRAERRLFTSPRLKAVVCNSRMVKSEIKHYFGVGDDKLHVIYSGVDVTEYHPRLRAHRAAIRSRHGVAADATLFLFVGSGFERKGVPTLIDAMSGLKPSAHLLIVGRDKAWRKYERRANALGLAGRVTFVGDQEDVKPYYGAADAFVLPTLYDPFPNVVLEALACGLPVVTSTKSGAAELIENGRNGFVCGALDRDKLLGALDALCDGRRRASMSEAARLAVESLKLDDMAERMLALYRRLADAHA
jgi:UDP-glucose:(heptosyl)LPS alpha-1,3-glucosyltransferase